MSAHRRNRSTSWNDEESFRGSRSAVDGFELLAELASIAVDAEDSKQAALACLEACSSALGAASGFVALAAGTDAADERLEIAAMVGPHAPLLGEVTRVGADEQAEVTVVFSTGEPHFVGSVYDGSGEPSDGTARWRGLISAQATAVLPIGTSTRRFGVLMLEWSQVQEFGEQIRTLLIAAARLTALAVERAWASDAESAEEPRFDSATPPVIVGRPPLALAEDLEPGVVPVVPAVVGDAPLRFELTAEGLVIPRSVEEPWGAGSVQVTIPATQKSGLLLDVHPVGSGRVLIAVAAISGASGTRLAELVEMLRHTIRVLSGRSQSLAVLDEASLRLREFGGAAMALEGWIGVFDAVNGSLAHAQSGRAGSRMLMSDGRDFEGSADAPSTWLPLSGDVLHAWVPGVASVRAEWR